MTTTRKYYVYGITTTDNLALPVYIGKGIGSRIAESMFHTWKKLEAQGVRIELHQVRPFFMWSGIDDEDVALGIEQLTIWSYDQQRVKLLNIVRTEVKERVEVSVEEAAEIGPSESIVCHAYPFVPPTYFVDVRFAGYAVETERMVHKAMAYQYQQFGRYGTYVVFKGAQQ